MSAPSLFLKYVQQSFAHWSPNEGGPFVYALKTEGVELRFSSHTQLSDKQFRFLELVQASTHEWLSQPKLLSSRNVLKMFNEELLVHWISQFSPQLSHEKWLHSLEHLRHRSYENRKLKLNLIVTKGQGSFDFLDSNLQKIFNPLANDASVYFRVDYDFHFLAYDELDPLARSALECGTMAPECVQAFLSLLEPGDLFIHYNIYGETLIASREGLLARYRRGQWLLYEPKDLYVTFLSLFGNPGLGQNLLELLFELSYRRHGALLIFDREHRLLNHISNPEVLSPHDDGSPDAHKLLHPIIACIDLSSPLARERRKHLVLELAEVDGAVVFDTQKILAFGAMIEPFGTGTPCYGSRTLAALSAASRHAIACKVSSEGDISLYFQEKETSSPVTELKIF